MPSYQQLPYWHASMPAIPAFDGRPLPERADVVIVGRRLHRHRRGAPAGTQRRPGHAAGEGVPRLGRQHPQRRHVASGPQVERAATAQSGTVRSLGGGLFHDGVDAFFTAERFITDEGFDCDYRRSGLALLAWSKGQLAGLEEELEEFRDAGLTGRVLPGRRGPLRSSASDLYPGGIAVEESGMIHPGRYMAAIAAAGVAAGVDFHTGRPPSGIERDGADRVVYTPAWRDPGGRRAHRHQRLHRRRVPWLRERVMPIGSYIIATEPMSEELAASVSPRGRTFFDAKNFLYYWHVNAERRLIFGGRASLPAAPSVDQTAGDPAHGAGGGPPPGGRSAHRAMRGAATSASRSTACRTWASTTASTTPSATAAAGVALGTTFGLRMARILGRSTEVADEPLAFERTPVPGRPGGARAYRGRPGSCRGR